MTKERRMPFTEVIQDFLEILREERSERRRRKSLSPQERAFEDITRSHSVHRAEVSDGSVFKALREAKHGQASGMGSLKMD